MTTQILNSANAVYSFGEGSIGNSTSNIAVATLQDEYSISAIKISNNTAFRINENVTYQILVKNTGTSTLFGVSLQDNMGGLTPVPLTYVTSSAYLLYNGSLSQITPTAQSPLTFVLPNPLLAGEEALVTYVSRVINSLSEDITEITNTVQVVGHELSSSGIPVTVTPPPFITLPIDAYANITMLKEVSSDNITAGVPFSYNITFSNTGNQTATGLYITDILPNGYTLNQAYSVTNGITTTYDITDYTIDAGTNKLTLPTTVSKQLTIPAGESSIITLVGQID